MSQKRNIILSQFEIADNSLSFSIKNPYIHKKGEWVRAVGGGVSSDSVSLNEHFTLFNLSVRQEIAREYVTKFKGKKKYFFLKSE